MKYCNNLYNYSRFESREVTIGSIALGGKNPIRIQSMNNTNTLDTENSVEQAKRIADAGADYVRLTAPGTKDAENLQQIKQALLEAGYTIPLIADIHFNPQAAIIAAQFVEKVRINPGNFADKRASFAKVEFSDQEYAQELDRIHEKLLPLLAICKQRKVALRIGTNHGSLSDRIMTRYGDTPDGMVESVMEFLRLCRKEDFHNLVISLKASNTRVMIQAYRLMVNKMMLEGMNYPLHLGVTEAGEGEDGRIKSAIGIGALLADGIGDTIRVSLTEEPEYEVPVAKKLVDYFSARLGHEAIRESIFTDKNPFKYEKRESFAVQTVGGSNVPAVMVEAKHFFRDNLSEIGYILKGETYHKQDISADFLVMENMPNFQLPQGLSVLVPLEKYKPQQNIFPLLSLKEFLRENMLEASNFFVEISFLGLNDVFLQKIKFAKNVVLIFKTKNTNRFAEIRAFFYLLLENEITNPVIVRNDYFEQNIEDFQLKSAADTGAAFIDGFGDGILLGNEAKNSSVTIQTVLQTSFGILQASRVRVSKTEYISCPGCGRTLFGLQETTAKVRARTSHLKGLKIAVMGCIVNGPGEMADADYGYVGAGVNKINLYKGQNLIKRGIAQADAVDELIGLIKENGDWFDAE